MKMLLLSIVFLVIFSSSQAVNYCRVATCPYRTHTLCRFPNLSHPLKCGEIISESLRQDEKQTILDLHNQLRWKVYSGREQRGRPGPQPPAILYFGLEWDEELAMIAQRWADQCHFAHDFCRDQEFFSVGQNIAQEATLGDVEILKVQWLVKKWYEGVRGTSRFNVKEFRLDETTETTSLQYSQMVWGQTFKIGCGGIKFFDEIYKKFLLVCNYAPAGNVPNSQMYFVE